jgi:putative tricarboxylic transport membrane protein
MKRNAVLPVVVFLAVLTLATMTPAVAAAEYPDKPIEFVVHSAAGGGADAFLRQTALFLNDSGIVKQKIQVVNRPGGSATVAVNYLASKKGDPNVLLGWTTAPLIAILRGTTTVKDIADLTLLSAMAEDPSILAVRADSKYKILRDLVNDARKNPDKIKVGIASVGGSEHIIVNRLEKEARIKFNITAFSTASYISLLGGHIDFAFATPVQVAQSVAAGKLRILAAAGEDRTQFAPEAPTMREQGVSTSFTQLRGFWGPPGMPDYAIKFWGQAFAKLAEAKEFKDLLGKIEMDPVYMGPDEMKRFIPRYAKELAADLKELEVYGGKKN